MSVKEEASSLEDLFYIPIPQAAAEELEDLRVMIQSFMLSEETDQRIFCWDSSLYTAAKLYKLAFLTMQTPAVFRLVWKSKVTPRIKFFAWLILLDRLNTKNMLAVGQEPRDGSRIWKARGQLGLGRFLELKNASHGYNSTAPVLWARGREHLLLSTLQKSKIYKCLTLGLSITCKKKL